jgi:ribonucleoside-diphosphate reductase alpha chain
VNPIFEQTAKDQGFYSEALMDRVLESGTLHGLDEVPEHVRDVFVTSHEIAPEWHVRMQAAFQKSTDNAVSKTINLSHDASAEEVAGAYQLAYETGCMGITVFRDGCKGDQVLNVGVPSAAAGKGQGEGTPGRNSGADIKPRPAVVHGYTRAVKAPEGTVNITINSDDDGPLEVFVNVGRAGNDIAAMAEAIGRLISLNLRLPSPMSPRDRMKEMAAQLRNIGGSRTVGFGPEQVRSLPDAVGQSLDKHLAAGTNGNSHGHGAGLAQALVSLEPAKSWTGNLCPQCGGYTLAFEEGCKKCHGCGYSEC